ncbi:MAG: ABC-2 family transporter protein [Kouleothrix sp.]|nr:ABC-2 family transporter protein [Kouleothrix sp.]
MIEGVRRQLNVYGAFAGMVPKQYLAYNLWAWMEFFVQIVAMTIFVFFWRAVYASSTTIGGLTLQQTINYILLAQTLNPLIENRLIFRFGWIIREGYVAVELMRPVDFQLRSYVEELASLLIFLAQKIPLVILAWLLFGLQLPADPALWGCFLISLLLGQALLFCFDWAFACIAFYSTETWGLSVVRVGVAAFFSGSLLPLQMLPGWLRALADALPFAQALYVPVSFLSRITPASDAPRVWLTQALWLAGLLALSRLVFRAALRKVTVQGG